MSLHGQLPEEQITDFRATVPSYTSCDCHIFLIAITTLHLIDQANSTNLSECLPLPLDAY